MTSSLTIYNMPVERIEAMREIVQAHPDTKPGAVASIFIILSLREMRRRYFSDFPTLGLSPQERNLRQIALYKEYFNARGITKDYLETE
jgi:hypothetical protein